MRCAVLKYLILEEVCALSTLGCLRCQLGGV
jgi:hypothetical protein